MLCGCTSVWQPGCFKSTVSSLFMIVTVFNLTAQLLSMPYIFVYFDNIVIIKEWFYLQLSCSVRTKLLTGIMSILKSYGSYFYVCQNRKKYKYNNHTVNFCFLTEVVNTRWYFENLLFLYTTNKNTFDICWN